MMVQRPQQWIESMADAGVDQYTFHIEPVIEQVDDISRKIRESGMKVGLALKPGTPLEDVVKYIPLADMILVMTGMYHSPPLSPFLTQKKDENFNRNISISSRTRIWWTEIYGRSNEQS